MAITDFYRDTITLNTKTEDRFGEPTATTSTSLKARVVIHEQSVVTSTGAEFRVKGLAWLADTTVDPDYTLTYDSIEYAIAFIDKEKAKSTSVHHLRIGLA